MWFLLSYKLAFITIMRRLFWFSQIHVSPGLQHGPASFSSCMAILGAGILPEWHALARSPYENKPLDDFNVIGVPPWKGGFHIAQELWSLVDFPWYSWSFLSWYGQSKEAYVQAITRVSNIDIYSWATHRHHLKARAGGPSIRFDFCRHCHAVIQLHV